MTINDNDGHYKADLSGNGRVSDLTKVSFSAGARKLLLAPRQLYLETTNFPLAIFGWGKYDLPHKG